MKRIRRQDGNPFDDGSGDGADPGVDDPSGDDTGSDTDPLGGDTGSSNSPFDDPSFDNTGNSTPINIGKIIGISVVHLSLTFDLECLRYNLFL